MPFDLQDAAAHLATTPRTLRSLLDNGRHPWASLNYGPDTFSPYDVVGHLIHGEMTDWIPRLRIIIEHGESRPFDPFDRYAMYEHSRGKSLAALLDEFEELRARNIETLQAMKLDPHTLDRRGRHPALGPVTARQLLATWVAHDLNHIAQICKALAFQYRDEVGPWLAYLSILRPPNPT
jgi:hypothetical protein